jgi:hypothetical protein
MILTCGHSGRPKSYTEVFLLIQAFSMRKANIHNGGDKPAHYSHAVREWLDEQTLYNGF